MAHPEAPETHGVDPAVLRYLQWHENHEPVVAPLWETPYVADSFPFGEDWLISEESFGDGAPQWASPSFYAHRVPKAALDQDELFLLRLDILRYYADRNRWVEERGPDPGPLWRRLRHGREHWGLFSEHWQEPDLDELRELAECGGFEGAIELKRRQDADEDEDDSLWLLDEDEDDA